MSSIVILAILAFTRTVVAHSWLECSSYEPDSLEYESLGAFDRSKCKGYPRGFARQFNEGFGIDTGYNWEQVSCSRDQFNENDYSDMIPMAELSPGQTFYMSHPSKNHVADVCTNPFIPSKSFVVKMSSEVGVDSFDIDLVMFDKDHENGKIDHLGYQRCFDFCANQDKAHCLTGWTLPNDVQEGRHSFMWLWQFNDGQFYANCFDAYVGGNRANGSTPMPTSVMTETPVTPMPTSVMTEAPMTEAPMTEAPMPTSVMTEAPMTEPPMTETPMTEAPVTDIEVISSDGSQLISPLVKVKQYIMNITGTVLASFNITISEL